MTDHFTAWDWTLCLVAAVCIGLSKTGFNGVALVSVALLAGVLPARVSVGVVLPMLIFADCFAVRTFRQHARWEEIRRVLPPALLGVVAGAVILKHFDDQGRATDVLFKRVVGGIVLTLTLLQSVRAWRPRWFAWEAWAGGGLHGWTMGGLAGITTMLANAAGPVMSLYLLAVGLPKMELVGTSAWVFLILNLCKVPINVHLGLIGSDSLRLNLYLLPGVIAGLLAGRALLRVVPEKGFQQLLLAFAIVASLRLLCG